MYVYPCQTPGARTGEVTPCRGVKDRQEAILRGLGLIPPLDSPFADALCLDGVRELVKLKEAGRWPPPHVPLQQQTVYGVQYPTTSVAPALPHQLSHMTTKPIPLLQVCILAWMDLLILLSCVKSHPYAFLLHSHAILCSSAGQTSGRASLGKVD